MCVQKSNYVTLSFAFSFRYAKTRTSNFRKVVRQYTECMVGSIKGFVGNLPGFPAVKKFWKSVKNWQSYRHELRVLLIWCTTYFGTQCIHESLISKSGIQSYKSYHVYCKIAAVVVERYNLVIICCVYGCTHHCQQLLGLITSRAAIA